MSTHAVGLKKAKSSVSPSCASCLHFHKWIKTEVVTTDAQMYHAVIRPELRSLIVLMTREMYVRVDGGEGDWIAVGSSAPIPQSASEFTQRKVGKRLTM